MIVMIVMIIIIIIVMASCHSRRCQLLLPHLAGPVLMSTSALTTDGSSADMSSASS